METRNYPTRWSDVEVIFKTGEVKVYTIKCSVGIAGYLSRDMGDTGVLRLMLPERTTVCISADAIQEFSVRELPNAEARIRGLSTDAE